MILYELLTQRVAFDANTVSGLLASIVADPPVHISQLRPDLAPGLAAAIMRCLEKDVRSRTPSIAEFAKSLSAFAPPISQRSIDRVARLLPPDLTLPDSARGETAFAATAPAHSAPMTPRGQTAPARTGPGSVAAGVTGNPAWGQTLPDPAAAAPKRAGVLVGGIIGAAAIAVLGVGGFVALRHFRPAPVHEPAVATAPPPAVVSVAAPSATPVASATPIASATPVASATPAAGVAKNHPGKTAKPVPETSENKHGDLGAAMDSRK
jgi:serine/threonine-protein kinase